MSDSMLRLVVDGYVDDDTSNSGDGDSSSSEDEALFFDAGDNNVSLDDETEDNGQEQSVSQNITDAVHGSDSGHDYFGESDLEILNDEDTLQTDDHTELSSVHNSEVTACDQNEHRFEKVMEGVRAEENMERYWMMKGMTFISEDAAYDFYNSYAKAQGFSIRRGKVRRRKGDPAAPITLRKFFCSREGRRNPKFLTMDGRKQRLRPESRCGCTAQLTVKVDKTRGVWFVDSFSDNHNHVLARPDEVPFLWSHRKIKDSQRAEILSMSTCGLRTHEIMKTFLSRVDDFGDVGFVRRDIYNMTAAEKRKLIARGDAATAIGIMEARKKSDADFFYDYQLDKKGRLKSMFWCDSQSRRDYQDFGDVVVFDSTYKMNRYSMPFIPFVGLNSHRKTTVFACAVVSNETTDTYVWVLKTFLNAMYQKKPKGVITDGDHAMLKAIKNVFKGVGHRVCSWHIEKNMKKHLRHEALNEFRSLLYYTTSETKFNERWNAFVRDWGTPQISDWLLRMYRKRKLWAASFLAGGFWLGMKSNQRSESLNSCLHLHLDFGMTLVDLIFHYENAILRIREKEANDDCVDSQTVPVAVTRYKRIEVAAAHAFTAANFYIVQEELNNIGGLVVLDKLVGNVHRYVVAWKDNMTSKFNVEYKPENPDEIISCSCRRMTRKGLPCKHILFVLNHLNLDGIPDCCVLRRFSKKSRLGLPARRKSDLYGFRWGGAGLRKRYSEGSVLCAEALQVACNDPDLWDDFKEYMNLIKMKKRRHGYAPAGQRSFADEDADLSQVTAAEVGDSIKCSTKGAPKGNNDEPKNDPPMTKNGRPLAYDERPNRNQRCGVCKLKGHNKRSKLCKQHPSNVLQQVARE